MAFYTVRELIKRTETRLRQVAGQSAQLYSEPVIKNMLQETYEMVRAQRFWDHLIVTVYRQLTPGQGTVAEQLPPTVEGWRDVQAVFHGRGSKRIPVVGSDFNPAGLTGTMPRYIQPLGIAEDPTQRLLFRVWPVTAVTTADKPLLVRLRSEGNSDLFSNVDNVVPFDWTVLVNGAAAKYAADDGNNPAAQAILDRTFNERLQQLQAQHDSVVLELDPRMTNVFGGDQWSEHP